MSCHKALLDYCKYLTDNFTEGFITIIAFWELTIINLKIYILRFITDL